MTLESMFYLSQTAAAFATVGALLFVALDRVPGRGVRVVSFWFDWTRAQRTTADSRAG